MDQKGKKPDVIKLIENRSLESKGETPESETVIGEWRIK